MNTAGGEALVRYSVYFTAVAYERRDSTYYPMLTGGLGISQAVASANVFPLAAALILPAAAAVPSPSPVPKVTLHSQNSAI